PVSEGRCKGPLRVPLLPTADRLDFCPHSLHPRPHGFVRHLPAVVAFHGSVNGRTAICCGPALLLPVLFHPGEPVAFLLVLATGEGERGKQCLVALPLLQCRSGRHSDDCRNARDQLEFPRVTKRSVSFPSVLANDGIARRTVG